MIKCIENPLTLTPFFLAFSLSKMFHENFTAILFLFKGIAFPEKCNQFNSKISRAARGSRVWNHGSGTCLVIRITWEALRISILPVDGFCLIGC